MQRVVGAGGIFLKTKNPGKLREWYRDQAMTAHVPPPFVAGQQLAKFHNCRQE